VDVRMYIRFGDLPPGERSSTGRREALAAGFPRWIYLGKPDFEIGVSVFSGRRRHGSGTRGGVYVADVSASVGLAVCLAYLIEQDIPAYLATGRRVGTGGCGEPLLRGVTLKPLPLGSRVVSSGHHAFEAAQRLHELKSYAKRIGAR
jgi:hypothetical protein